MAEVIMTLDPAAAAYTSLAEVNAAEGAKLTGIEDGAEVNDADLAELDPTASAKLGGIEDAAKDDQTAPEIEALIVAQAPDDRKIVISDPETGEKKVYELVVNADTKLDVKHSDTAV